MCMYASVGLFVGDIEGNLLHVDVGKFGFGIDVEGLNVDGERTLRVFLFISLLSFLLNGKVANFYDFPSSRAILR